MAYSFNYALSGSGTFKVADAQIRPDYLMSQWVPFNADSTKIGTWAADNLNYPPLLRCLSATGFTGRYNPGALNMTDYTFSTSILGSSKDTERNLIGVMFRYIDSNHYYFFAWDGGGGFGWTGEMRLYKVTLGGQIKLASKASSPWSNDSNFHSVKVTTLGNRFQVWVDNIQVFDYTDVDAPYMRGAYGPFTGFQEASYEYFTGIDYKSFKVNINGQLSIPESAMDFASGAYGTSKLSDLLDRELRNAATASSGDPATVQWAGFSVSTTDTHARVWLGANTAMPTTGSDPNAKIGAYSDIAKVPPLAPTGLVGHPRIKRIDWEWTNVSLNAEGVEVLNEYGDIIATLSPNESIFSQINLEGGTSYKLSVRTYNKWGKSPITGPITAIPFGRVEVYVQPPAPSAVSGVLSGNAITWSWIFPTIYDDLVGFHIYDQFTGTLIANAGPDARTWTQRNILIDKPYGIRVRAYNVMEEGYPTDSPELIIPAAATPSTPVPASPANFKGELIDTSTIVWKWADTSNGQGYFILYDASGQFVARIEAGTTKYTEEAQPNTTYQRYATVIFGDVESGPSQTGTVITPAAPVETPVVDVDVFDPNSVICEWIPKEGNSKIAAFKSGVGDGLNLITRVDTSRAANESFNYTMQLKAFMDQVLRIYPKRSFQFRFIAAGDKPVIADRGNYSAQLTLWPRRQATVVLTASEGAEVRNTWTIPLNIWAHQSITVASLSDYPVNPPAATPADVVYSYTVTGDSQVQVAWNDDHSALLAATADSGLSATWAGQVTITQQDLENCQYRILVPNDPAYQNGHWTFKFLSSDPTVSFTFNSGATGYSSQLSESILIQMSVGNNYEAWTATSDWFNGTVNGALPITKNGDGYQVLQVPIEMLLPNGLINLKYTIEMLNTPTATPSTPAATPAATPVADVKFYLQKGTGSTTTHNDDVVTFYCDTQSNLAIPQPWYGVISVGSGPYNVMEAGLSVQELIPSPMKDPTALVYVGEVATLKPLYNFSLLVTSNNPNVAISYQAPLDWAPDQLNVAINLKAEIVNPTQTPWHPVIHNGHYYLNQSEHYLYAASDVKGEVKTLDGFSPVSFTYSVGIDAVKDYLASTQTWEDTKQVDFGKGQLQGVDIVTVPGDMTIALDSNNDYVAQGVYISDQKPLPYAASSWGALVADYINVGNSSVDLLTRSRKADGLWDDWKAIAGNGAILSAVGDILQYQVVLNRGEIHTATTTTKTDQAAADFLQGEMTDNTSLAGFGVTATDPAHYDGTDSAIYTSRVFDIGAYITDMGSLSFDVITPQNSTGAAINIFTASSDSPSGPWSTWTALAAGNRIASAAKRYVRYQARFKRGSTPSVLNYNSDFAADKNTITNITINGSDIQAAANQGVYLSKVIDTGHIASYGAITLNSTAAPVGGSVVLEMTTGDNLSDLGVWHDVGLNDMPPLARYLQYRITINRGESTPVTSNFTDSGMTHVFDMGNVKDYQGLTSIQSNPDGSSISFTTQTSSDNATWSPEVAVSGMGIIASPANRYLKYKAYPQEGTKVEVQDITDNGGTSNLIQPKVVNSSLFPTLNASAFNKLTYDIPGGLPDSASIVIETSSDGGSSWQTLNPDGSITSPVSGQIEYRATLTPGYGIQGSKTVNDNAILNQVDSYTSGTLDFYGRVVSWDHLQLAGNIPADATVTVWTASSNTASDLTTPAWIAASSIVSSTAVTATIQSPVARYIKYRVDVSYAATPQATPATPQATVWSSADIVANHQPFSAFTFNTVHLGWNKTTHPQPTLTSVTISASTFTPISAVVHSLAFTINTIQYVAATLKKAVLAVSTYMPTFVTPTLRGVQATAYLDSKEFVFSYSTSLTGQVASDMNVHQVSTRKLKDIMHDYLNTQGINIADLAINNYDIKHVDPSVVLSTTDYQAGTGYVMAQTTSTNPKPLINDAQVIYVSATKSALISPVPRQGAPVIVVDQRNFEMRQVFFVDEAGNQTLTNTEFFTADGVSREVALNYQGVDINSIQIYIDPNKDGNWVLEGPISTVQKNFALCNNTLSLPHIYSRDTWVKVRYNILDSFYVDYNYDPKGIYAKIYLNNCIPIVDPGTGLITLDVSYETKDDTAYYEAEEINLNPMLNVIESGFIYLSDTIEPAVKLEVYTNPDVLMATGYDKTVVIVMAKDRFGNPVIGEQIVFDAIDPLYSTRVGKGQIYTDVIGRQVAVTDEHGIARAIYLADSTPGNVILRVTDQTANLSAEKTLYLRAQNVHARISIEADKTQVTRDGQDAVLLTVTLVGMDQRPVVGETVTLTASAGNLSAAQVKTSFEGTSHSYLTVPTSVGEGLITVTATSAKYGIQQSIIINGQ